MPSNYFYRLKFISSKFSSRKYSNFLSRTTIHQSLVDTLEERDRGGGGGGGEREREREREIERGGVKRGGNSYNGWVSLVLSRLARTMVQKKTQPTDILGYDIKKMPIGGKTKNISIRIKGKVCFNQNLKCYCKYV